MSICSPVTAFATDDEPHDPPNLPTPGDPPPPSDGQPGYNWYKLRVTLGDLTITRRDDGDDTGKYLGTITLSGGWDAKVLNFGHFTTMKINSTVLTPGYAVPVGAVLSSGRSSIDEEAVTRFRALGYPASSIYYEWFTDSVSPIYSHREALSELRTGEAYSLASATPGLCTGVVRARLLDDPRCGIHNNIVDIWVNAGSGANIPGLTVNLDVNGDEYEQKICRTTLRFPDANKFNESLATGSSIYQKEWSNSPGEGSCSLDASVKVLGILDIKL